MDTTGLCNKPVGDVKDLKLQDFGQRPGGLLALKELVLASLGRTLKDSFEYFALHCDGTIFRGHNFPFLAEHSTRSSLKSLGLELHDPGTRAGQTSILESHTKKYVPHVELQIKPCVACMKPLIESFKELFPSNIDGNSEEERQKNMAKLKCMLSKATLFQPVARAHDQGDESMARSAIKAASMNPDPLSQLQPHILGPPGLWHDRYNTRLHHFKKFFTLLSKDSELHPGACSTRGSGSAARPRRCCNAHSRRPSGGSG